MGGPAFDEVAAGVHVLRYPVLDVNSTLIVGGEVAVLVDTLGTDGQAHELLDAVRAVTPLPLAVINTHHHFDHCFGNAAVVAAHPGCGIWAHEAAAAALREHGHRWQREWYEEWRPTHPDLAQALAEVEVHAPTRTVHVESTMDIGGRTVELRHFGRGHTAGDLVVTVPDAAVLLTGDLVEQGAPPSFGDSYPLDWPDTLAAMLHRVAVPAAAALTVVPGHGDRVDAAFVRGQHAELTELAWLIREGHASGAAPAAVSARAPYAADVALTAVRRGYAELAGRL
jgi:glyoxylase-like metal-dependent hydrolase (beta-lactamase superfamily II)